MVDDLVRELTAPLKSSPPSMGILGANIGDLWPSAKLGFVWRSAMIARSVLLDEFSNAIMDCL